MNGSHWMSYIQYEFQKAWRHDVEVALLREHGLGWIAGLTTKEQFEMEERQQIEKRLEEKYLNQLVSYTTSLGKSDLGKVMRISVWPKGGVQEVSVQIANKLYKCDLEYFEENIQIL